MKVIRATLKKLGLDKKESKYRNKRTVCLLKHTHDSKAEADYCNGLLADKKARRIHDFKVQVPYDLGAGIKHIVDFEVKGLVFEKGMVSFGFREVHDVKGYETAVWRMKHKLFVEKYPHIKYVVVRKDQSWTRGKKIPPALAEKIRQQKSKKS